MTTDPLDRIEARARQAVEYEEEGARIDGTTPDETWDEWTYGKDVLALVEIARAARDLVNTGLPTVSQNQSAPLVDALARLGNKERSMT